MISDSHRDMHAAKISKAIDKKGHNDVHINHKRVDYGQRNHLFFGPGSRLERLYRD